MSKGPGRGASAVAMIRTLRTIGSTVFHASAIRSPKCERTQSAMNWLGMTMSSVPLSGSKVPSSADMVPIFTTTRFSSKIMTAPPFLKVPGSSACPLASRDTMTQAPWMPCWSLFGSSAATSRHAARAAGRRRFMGSTSLRLAKSRMGFRPGRSRPRP